MNMIQNRQAAEGPAACFKYVPRNFDTISCLPL